MAHISEHIKASNQNFHSYDNIIKTIVNLISNKFENNNNSKCQLNHHHNSLLMSIVDTPENDASNIDRKLDKRRLCTSLMKASSTLFSCSIHAMYNRVHCAKTNLTLKSYIPGINT